MKQYFSSRYQRHKRILRIMSLQDGYDTYRPRRPSNDHFIFPRYTWVRFFLTLGLFSILSIPTSIIFKTILSVMSVKIQILILTPIAMMVGFLAVEIVDDYFLLEKSLEDFRKNVLPFIGLALLVLIFYVVKNPNGITRSVSEWRESVNEDLQVKPQPVVAIPTQGLNWRLVFETPNYLKKLTYQEATAYCKSLGADWQIFDDDKLFVAKPNPSFDRQFYVWQGMRGAGLDQYGIQHPKVFVSAEPGGRFSTLCINKRIRP